MNDAALDALVRQGRAIETQLRELVQMYDNLPADAEFANLEDIETVGYSVAARFTNHYRMVTQARDDYINRRKLSKKRGYVG